MKRKLSMILTCAIFSMAVSACSSGSGSVTSEAGMSQAATQEQSAGESGSEAPAETSTEPAAEATTEPATESSSGKTDIVVGYAQECATLDPNNMSAGVEYSIATNIYEGLVWVNDELEVEPLLAESWDISEDGTVYTFHLRDGVTFHNGEPLTANDVAFSYQRAIDGGYAGSVAGVIDSFRAVDDLTFEVTLQFPYAPAIELFGAYWLRVVSQKAVEDAGDDFSFNPVGAGTGPYRFIEWNSGSNVIMEAYEDYWREPASIKNLEWRFVLDTTTLSLAIETGDVDVGYIQAADLEYFDQHDEVDYLLGTSIIENYVGFNCNDEYFSDPRIRQAISLCIDRTEALIVGNDSENGAALTAIDTPADGFGADTSIPVVEVDIERAKELLAEAGYPDGFNTEIHVQNLAARKNMATYIQGQIAQIGIHAEIVAAEQSVILENMREGKAPIFLMGYSGTSGDADFFLYPQYHSGQTFNYFNYYNDELDAKLEAARASTDPDERIALYKEIQQEIYEQVPNMPMYHIYFRLGFNSNLSATVSPFTRMNVYDWHWK